MISLDEVFSKSISANAEVWGAALFARTLGTICKRFPDWALDWDEDAGEDVARFSDVNRSSIVALLFKKVPVIFAKNEFADEMRDIASANRLELVNYQEYSVKDFSISLHIMEHISQRGTSHRPENAISVGDLYFYCV